MVGVGAVTPYGVGIHRYWEEIIRGRSAASPITSFDASELPTRFAAQVPLTDDELDPLIDNKKSLKTISRALPL